MTRALEETGQVERTIFAFTSDHGEMVGDHRMLEKRVRYEESARVPFLLRVPWMSATQKRIGGVCDHADMVPTLLDLAGQLVPPELPGQSLAGALTGERDLTANDAFIEWSGIGLAQSGGYVHDTADGLVHDRNLGSPEINAANANQWRSIVSGDRWKLNLCAQDRCELFDLNSDPHELRNLYDDPRHGDRVLNLSTRVRKWQRDTDDEAPLPLEPA